MADPRGYPAVDMPSPFITPTARALKFGPCMVIVEKEPPGWHLSISCRDRLPTWDEIMEARTRFLPPDIFLVMMVPPERYWLNIHRYCLHLRETRDPLQVQMMVDEGEAAREMGAGKRTVERMSGAPRLVQDVLQELFGSTAFGTCDPGHSPNIYLVGYTDEAGVTVVCGEGLSWNEAIDNSNSAGAGITDERGNRL